MIAALRPLVPASLLIALLASGCAPDGDGRAEKRRARIAILLVSDAYVALSADGLREGMRALGYREGLDVEYTVYNAGGDPQILPSLVRQALASEPDVICPSTVTAIDAVKATGTRIPVVFLESMYPVEFHIVESLEKPGTNYTGVSNMTGPMSGKRLELLKRMCPGIRRVGLLFDPGNKVARLSFEATRSAAARLGLELVARPFAGHEELDATLRATRTADIDALVLNPDFMVFSRVPEIVSLAKARKLPTMGFDPSQVEAGLLASYGGGLKDIARRAAVHVDRVLRGESPAVIPVEAPRKYSLLVNMRTAAEIGLHLPDEILYQADGYVR